MKLTKPKLIALICLGLAAVAIVAIESIGHQQPVALTEDRYKQQMMELEAHAIAIGDERLAQHIRCEYDPPTQVSNQSKCTQLAEYYRHESSQIPINDSRW